MTSFAPRETFDKQLQHLQDQILVLGSMVSEAVLHSVDALKHRDLTASEQVYEADVQINEKRYSIENDVLTLIATQQPMARDLRILAAILEINTELERIGDYAKGIARINMMLGENQDIKPSEDINRMANLGVQMLSDALTAFVSRDVEAARSIPERDDEVDQLYNKVYRGLLDIMIADQTKIDRANYLVWAAHNLERLADRVTNVCERIVFVVTGEIRELDRTDDELRHQE